MIVAMLGLALAASGTVAARDGINATAGLARSEASPDADRAAFARQIAEYQVAIRPMCQTVTPNAYQAFARERDAAFRASLRGTVLDAVYVAALRRWRDDERHRIRECLEPPPPPPPPPPPGTPPAPAVDPRTGWIEATQQRLRREADSIPAHFDEGDAMFAELVALRDRILRQEAR